MDDVFVRLEKVREKLKYAEEMTLRLQGKKDGILEELKSLGFSSPKEAEKAVIKMDKELDKIEKKLEGQINDFESKYSEFLAS